MKITSTTVDRPQLKKLMTLLAAGDMVITPLPLTNRD